MIGSVWDADSWAVDAWGEGTWGDSASAFIWPGDVHPTSLTASQVTRTLTSGEVSRSLTSDE